MTNIKKDGKYEGQFPERWLPAAIAIINEAFSEENKLINSTLKMVRGKIVEYHKDKLNYLFTPEAKEIINIKNLEEISKF